MRRVTNVVRRGAVFYFRRRAPSNLQPLVGKAVIRESLDTREAAKARRLAADRNLFWERRFEAAESQLAQAARPPEARTEAVVRKELADHELREIVASYRRQLLADDEEVRMRGLGGKSGGIPDHQHDALGEMLLDAEKFVAEDISRGKHLASWRLDEVDECLAMRGVTLDKRSESYKRLAIEFLDTAPECIQLWKDRHAGKIVRTPTPEPIQAVGRSTRPTRPGSATTRSPPTPPRCRICRASARRRTFRSRCRSASARKWRRGRCSRARQAEVEIKVETFNFTRYGLIHGRVIDVSRDAVTDDKRPTDGGAGDPWTPRSAMGDERPSGSPSNVARASRSKGTA